MKRLILGVLNVIAGIAQVIYLLFQNGTIVMRQYIENGKYTDEFYSFIKHTGIVIFAVLIVLIVFSVISLVKRKKGQDHVLGEVVFIAGSFLGVVSIAILGTVTIACLLCVIGGVIMVVKK